jgi:hypothetical protein
MAEEGFIQASFFTKEKRNEIKDIPFSLPLSATRDELTQLLLQLLIEENEQSDDTPKEFDFLINGSLLRKTLRDSINDLSLTLVCKGVCIINIYNYWVLKHLSLFVIVLLLFLRRQGRHFNIFILLVGVTLVHISIIYNIYKQRRLFGRFIYT